MIVKSFVKARPIEKRNHKKKDIEKVVPKYKSKKHTKNSQKLHVKHTKLERFIFETMKFNVNFSVPVEKKAGTSVGGCLPF